MIKTYTVTKIISQSTILAQDVLGRAKILQTDKKFNVGDPIRVTNDVVIGLTKRESIQIFNV